MKVHELGHVVLYVRDLERSRQFYRDVLGFPELPGAMPFAAAFSTGRTHHELLLIEVGADAAPIPAGKRVGMYHIGLKVGDSDDDLRAALEELQAAGADLVGSADHNVTHSLYLRDPDGNEIELYIDVPGSDWRDDPELILAPTKPLRL
jgi:catechol-2,3-dioxygenase